MFVKYFIFNLLLLLLKCLINQKIVFKEIGFWPDYETILFFS